LQEETHKGFNSVRRGPIFDELQELCPSMLPWLRQSFEPGLLLCGRQVVCSTLGVMKGESLGPFLFATALRRALAKLPLGGELHRWYLDDGVFLGSVTKAE